LCLILFFFFQAEDGIRDGHVTGVQTCALPILRDGGRAAIPCGRSGRAAWVSPRSAGPSTRNRRTPAVAYSCSMPGAKPHSGAQRSEERRGGKEGRRWGAAVRYKKKSDV